MQTLRRALTAIGTIALALVIVLFATQEINQRPVDVHYLWSTTQVPLWQLLGGAFLAGCLAAWLVTLLPWTRAKLNARRHRKRAERLETELHQLRNLPLSRDEGAATTSGLAQGSAGNTGSG